MQPIELLEEMFQSKSREGESGIIGFTQFLVTYPVNNETAPIYIKVLRNGISQVADILFCKRSPETFFSTLTPTPNLAEALMESLCELSPKKSDPRMIICSLSFYVLWISSRAFGGTSPIPNIQGLYQAAKFLIHPDSRVKEFTETLLEEISEKMYRGFPDVARTSLMILDAYRDKTKNLQNIMPKYLFQ